MPDQVTIYSIRLPHHRPAAVSPAVLAESWGSDITAPEAVEKMFGCIPFPYWMVSSVEDTPAGLEKRLGRMHTPERLFAARQERIKKRLAEKDPLFYDQMIGPALENDAYNLEYYRQRQTEIADMHRQVAVKAEQVGKLWISPEAERLRRFDWPAMALELRQMVMDKVDVYVAQDSVLKRHGAKNEI
jgi:hypothetical protein